MLADGALLFERAAPGAHRVRPVIAEKKEAAAARAALEALAGVLRDAGIPRWTGWPLQAPRTSPDPRAVPAAPSW